MAKTKKKEVQNIKPSQADAMAEPVEPEAETSPMDEQTEPVKQKTEYGSVDAQPPTPDESVSDSDEDKTWAFKSPVRCPRCQSLQTEARSTQGPIQYRQCNMAICRHRFSIRGEPI